MSRSMWDIIFCFVGSRQGRAEGRQEKVYRALASIMMVSGLRLPAHGFPFVYLLRASIFAG